jgi:hypothetical protein
MAFCEYYGEILFLTIFIIISFFIVYCIFDLIIVKHQKKPDSETLMWKIILGFKNEDKK